MASFLRLLSGMHKATSLRRDGANKTWLDCKIDFVFYYLESNTESADDM